MSPNKVLASVRTAKFNCIITQNLFLKVPQNRFDQKGWIRLKVWDSPNSPVKSVYDSPDFEVVVEADNEEVECDVGQKYLESVVDIVEEDMEVVEQVKMVDVEKQEVTETCTKRLSDKGARETSTLFGVEVSLPFFC